MDKVLTTIKQFFRDWSQAGAKERDMCYKPIVDEILTLFPWDTWYDGAFKTCNYPICRFGPLYPFTSIIQSPVIIKLCLSSFTSIVVVVVFVVCSDKKMVSILVPGAGLGRLAFEIAQCGYSCQGNEFSFFMLLGSNFVINQ